MAKKFPLELQNVLDGTFQSLANGGVVAAKVFTSRSTFVSASGNHGTSDLLSFGVRKKGQRVLGFILSSAANLSTASLAIGVAGTTGKYKAAAALPNATSVFVPCIATALDDAPLTEQEELIGTISGAAIPDGTLIVETVYAQH